MSYPQIAQRVFHTPLLAAPAKAAGFVMGLGPRLIGGGSIEFSGLEGQAITEPTRKPLASILDDRLGEEIQTGQREGFRMVDGIAVIPVTGTLIHRGSWVGSFSGEMSYEGVSAQIRAAAAHPGVKAIALEFDSHGGQVDGCFSLAAEIRAARDVKEVRAFVCDNAHSAAYALASQATSIIVPRAGSVGSIGVICLHADHSQQVEDAGLRVTIISAGAHKADFNPYEPLPDSVRDAVQKEMETLRGIFAETVAAGRGDRLSAEGALNTEAACLLGADAVEAGLADEVADPKEAFARFAANYSWRPGRSPLQATNEEKETMAKKPETSAVTGDETSTAPEAGANTADQTGTQTGTQAEAPTGGSAEAPVETNAGSGGEGSGGTSAETERTRIAGILGCDEAKGREDLAQSLAFNSSMSVDEAKKHLATAAVAGSGSTLSSQMETQGDADLDAPPAGSAQENPVKAAMRKRYG
ncbi:S49 family peptidase [Pseudophaeobacter sp.]|jgi:ClpP class serine protease